jgi:hypothetical protein
VAEGLEAHELIASPAVLLWLVHALEELVGWEDAGLLPFVDVRVIFASVNFFVTGCLRTPA